MDGASLMESVSQCAFMWKDAWPLLESIGHVKKVLIAQFCKGLSKSIGCMFTGVLAADIFEGES